MIHRESIIAFSTLLTFLFIFQLGCQSSETLSEKDPLIERMVESVETDISLPATFSQYPIREFRAAWVATVANIDWPSKPGLPVEQQKNELINLLNKASSLNLNAIIFQVRPAADAFYDSSYEPWSSFLTGTMGQAPLPGWDPLEFIIHEAHNRGLELHAWFNPYRAGHPADSSQISADHISKTQPCWVHQYGDFLWLDPGLPEVKEYTINVIMDVVRRYDIDGVHFDDYFYPYPSYGDNTEFPDSLAWQRALDLGVELSRDDWRRDNVNSMVQELYHRIKEFKPHVKFGISPFGIWRPGVPAFTNGFDAYTDLYADAKLWLNNGWLDYITPQIYYQMGQPAQPFPIMLNWWNEQNLQNRHLWPGLYTSRLWTPDRIWPTDELLGQIYTTRAFPGVTGAVHFSMKTFIQNSAGVNQAITSGPYAQQALVPPASWITSKKPDKPELSFYDYGEFWKTTFYTDQIDQLSHWVLRSSYDHGWESSIYPARLSEISFYGGEQQKRPKSIFLSAVNRTGLESDFAEVHLQEINRPLPLYENDSIIKRSDWSEHKPSGINANAIRRNISRNDTLRFHDLTMIPAMMMRSMAFPGRLMKVDLDGPDADDQYSESITIKLFRNKITETISMQPGQVRNWNGFQIALLNLDFGKNLADFEVATTASLSAAKVSMREAGNSDQRFKIPHNPFRIAVHSENVSVHPADSFNTVNYLNASFDSLAITGNDWDLPFHYYIDENGDIYEGRERKYSGKSLSSFDPRGTVMINLLRLEPGSQDEAFPKKQAEALVSLISKLMIADDLEIHQIFALEGLDSGAETSSNHLKAMIRDGSLQQLVIQKLGNSKGN